MKYICNVCGKIFDEEVIPYHAYPLNRMGPGAEPVLCVGSNMIGELVPETTFYNLEEKNEKTKRSK